MHTQKMTQHLQYNQNLSIGYDNKIWKGQIWKGNKLNIFYWYLASYLAHIYGVVVSGGVRFLKFVLGIFPCLYKQKNNNNINSIILFYISIQMIPKTPTKCLNRAVYTGVWEDSQNQTQDCDDMIDI